MLMKLTPRRLHLCCVKQTRRLISNNCQFVSDVFQSANTTQGWNEQLNKVKYFYFVILETKF